MRLEAEEAQEQARSAKELLCKDMEFCRNGKRSPPQKRRPPPGAAKQTSRNGDKKPAMDEP